MILKTLFTLARAAAAVCALLAVAACDPATPRLGPPDTALPAGEAGQLVRQGRLLAANSGPLLIERGGNGLRCGSCHLNAGTLPYAGAWVQLHADDALAARINRCLVESMNGQPLALDAPGMRALLAYIGWLSTPAPQGAAEPAAGARGFGAVDAALTPDRARGAALYADRCDHCHGSQGEGTRKQDGSGFKYPPLWGSEAFSAASEMTQLPIAAAFVKNNMPRTRAHPLSAQEAVDVAAYLIAQPRPGAAAGGS
ncbi:MAG: c-type cytochrome [Desulfovibrionaceae bacterium]|nr:c-type cytochrome [Desulfovibrionaceae bacterium]